jgi:chitin disaccharide deacetylase
VTNTKQLIVNADDFGLSDGVNRGVVQAHERGIVTSASLMVHAPAAAAAAEIAGAHPALSVGLHLDLGEWRYSNGTWTARYERAPLDDAKLLEVEVAGQFEKFASLLGTAPTHVDSHQHAHRNEPLCSIVTAKAAEFGIPVRHFTPDVRYCGDFYGQDDEGRSLPERVTAKFLAELLSSLLPGTTELCCHPAAIVDFDSTYSEERVRELAALCDPVLKANLERADIELRSFASATAS